MNEETIRTKALNTAREHWKGVLHFASWAMAALVTASVAVGHKQADKEMQAKDFQALQSEVKVIHDELLQVKESQARTEGTLNAVSLWAQGVTKFQTSVQKGAEEALAIPVPKLQGHRAKH